jgi:hypothetical protein
MLKFATLSLSQQKCVVALIEHSPSLKKDGRITLKEVVAITQDLAAKRSAGGVKIGYPNWLFKSNKVEKGVYQLPVPTAQELSDFAQASAPKVKVAKVKAVKAKTPKVTVKKAAVTKDDGTESRLQRIIEDSEFIDSDVEDFNQILRDNGIEV